MLDKEDEKIIKSLILKKLNATTEEEKKAYEVEIKKAKRIAYEKALVRTEENMANRRKK